MNVTLQILINIHNNDIPSLSEYEKFLFYWRNCL